MRSFHVLLGLSLAILFCDRRVLADNFYVGDVGENIIKKVDGAGVVSNFGAVPNNDNPEGLAFDTLGNLYVATNVGWIYRFAPDGTATTIATNIGTVRGITFDNSGNLYVADQSGGRIEKITPAGVISTLVSGLSDPTPLLFGPGQNLYSTSGTNNVIKITLTGVVSKYATVNHPEDLAFGSDGSLYTSAYATNTIYKTPPGGGTGTAFVTSGLSGPWGLVFGSGGDLFVVNNGNNTISEITPAGAVSMFAQGLSNPEFITSQIPEPSTCILLGISALGFLVSRTRVYR